MLKPSSLVKGNNYNWIGQPERLVYVGRTFCQREFWYQFALVDKPEEVWCEVLQSQLDQFEETKEPA